jgi:hypothetical protein
MKGCVNLCMNRSASTLASAVLVAAALFGLAACEFFGVAGSEVTNPPQKVAGVIRTEEGGPAMGAHVAAYPVDYDPDPSARAVPFQDHRDTTDAQGGFVFTGVDTLASHNVWAVDPASGKLALIRQAWPGADPGRRLPEGVLRRPGALSILIHDTLPHGKAHVYLAGTPRYRDLQSLNSEPGWLLLDSVPAGLIPRLYHKLDGIAGARTLLAENLFVRPGDTLPVGPYAAWSRSKRIFLNTTAAGAGVAGSVGAIPLLVRLDSLNFDFAQARPDGGDIRFSAKNGEPLPYEIETWDAAARKAALWVRAPAVIGDDSSQCLRLYWGNPGAASESRSAAVFDASFGYQGVWHLNALGAGTPPVLRDASTGGNDAYAGDLATGLALRETPFGTGMRQNGQRASMYTAKEFDNPQALTVSIWFRTTTEMGGLLIGFNRWQPNADSTLERDRQIWMDTNGIVRFGIATPVAGNPSVVERHFIASPAPLNDGAWHFAVGTFSSSGMAFYVDGVKAGGHTDVTLAQDYAGYWRMGFSYRMTDWTGGFQARYFNGDLDEGRVSAKVFPEDWIRLSYGNQAPGSKILRFEAD